MERQLLRIEDVCTVTSLGRSKVYTEIQAGRLKVVKIGKSVRVPTDELARYVQLVKAEAGLATVV